MTSAWVLEHEELRCRVGWHDHRSWRCWNAAPSLASKSPSSILAGCAPLATSANPVKFLRGLRPIADRAYELGMKFGIHVTIAQMAPDAPAAIEHPEWLAFGGDDYYGAGAICYGAFHYSCAAGKVMVAQSEGGRIINVSSVNGFF